MSRHRIHQDNRSTNRDKRSKKSTRKSKQQPPNQSYRLVAPTVAFTLALTGRILPSWSLFAGYTYLNSEMRLFREDRLDDVIPELRRGLEGNPQHATGYSNLGFLYLRKGQLEQAVECLLHALEVDPQHQVAPDHLFDVLRALIDELVQIGLTDGFLSTRPAGKFDEYNRHMRAREIGHLIVKIG
jgi:tetratricopeptide (TPR) repeat protein